MQAHLVATFQQRLRAFRLRDFALHPRTPCALCRRPKITDAFGRRRIRDHCVAHRSHTGVCSLFSPCARGAPTPSVLPVIFARLLCSLGLCRSMMLWAAIPLVFIGLGACGTWLPPDSRPATKTTSSRGRPRPPPSWARVVVPFGGHPCEVLTNRFFGHIFWWDRATGRRLDDSPAERPTLDGTGYLTVETRMNFEKGTDPGFMLMVIGKSPLPDGCDSEIHRVASMPQIPSLFGDRWNHPPLFARNAHTRVRNGSRRSAPDGRRGHRPRSILARKLATPG